MSTADARGAPGTAAAGPPPLRLVVVDDEPLARDNVRAVLEGEPVTIVAECGTGVEAVALIDEHDPDLVLLDIELPDFDGFEVLGRLSEKRRPAVVFVTAWREHAVRAFDVHAADYVVKPFRDERLREAVLRARERVRRGEPERMWERLEALVEQLDESGHAGVEDTTGADPSVAPLEGRWARRILVGERDRRRFLPVERVDWLEAEGNYVRLHAGGEEHLVRATLTGLLDQLDPGTFLRIHRGTAVNLDRVREIQPWFAGRWIALLEDGTQLRVSRGYREGLLRLTL